MPVDFGICDIMLNAAQRIVTSRWLKAQGQHPQSSIVQAVPGIDPRLKGKQ